MPHRPAPRPRLPPLRSPAARPAITAISVGLPSPLHSSRGGSNHACSNHACDPWVVREERRPHHEGVHLHPQQQELLIAAVAQEWRQVHRAVAAGVAVVLPSMAGTSSGAGGCPSSRPRAASATAAAGVTSPPPWPMRAQEQEATQVPVPMAEHAGERVSAAAQASELLPRPTTCYACSPCPGSQPPSRVLSPISGCRSNTSSSSSSTAASSRRTSATSAARSSRNATLWTLLQAHSTSLSHVPCKHIKETKLRIIIVTPWYFSCANCLTDGSVFYSGYDRGWDQGLLGMCVSEKQKLMIPAKMGYDARGTPQKIPGNGRCCSSAAIKKEIYACLCRPTLFDGGTMEFWIQKNKGGFCMSISSKSMWITERDDRKYWSHLSTEESSLFFRLHWADRTSGCAAEAMALKISTVGTTFNFRRSAHCSRVLPN